MGRFSIVLGAAILLLASSAFAEALPGGVTQDTLNAAFADLSVVYGSPVVRADQAKAICNEEQYFIECAEIGQKYDLFSKERAAQVTVLLEEFKGKVIAELKQCGSTECLVGVATSLARKLASDHPILAHAVELTPQKVQEKKDVAENGYDDKAVKLLKEKGLAFENAGALWFRSTDFGDDKDRVLVKRDGAKTYLASDCGYLLHKMERGFDRLIEVWGADHHGYVARFQAAAQALGFVGKIDFILVQLVKLVKDGQEVKMSKRVGNVVTIDELIEKVGHAVARFFFLLYAPETQMNFDLGLAEERSQKNPVFYVQYAHARLCSILRKAEEEGLAKTAGDLDILVHPKERELIRELLYFPELIETIAEELTVHTLSQYAIRLADKLHSFYADCRVLDKENKPLSLARLELIRAVKVVLAETFHLMGIAAPEKM